MTLLSAILPKHLISPETDIQINTITLDSRSVEPGSVFFAFKGASVDGHDFIPQAVEKGASAILCERQLAEIYNIPVIVYPELRHKCSEIAAQFYNNPSQTMMMVGITGTNGKTSVCHFLTNALHILKQKSGMLGTTGNGLYGQLDQANLTTPDPIKVQALLKSMKEMGATHVAMETSSHALDQGRVAAVEFDVAIYTHLTQDHLDYHQTMENYAQSKAKLFQTSSLKTVVINNDCTYKNIITENIHHNAKRITYGIKNDSDVKLTDWILHKTGLSFSFTSPWGEGHVETQLIGQFNLENLLATIATLGALNFSITEICQTINQLKPVPGRMALLTHGETANIVIDYAHTPDALQKALEACRSHCKGHLWAVFGCGGDRDRTKRPIMAKIAEDYADQLVLTEDNPRNENQSQIFKDMLPGFSKPDCVTMISNRQEAIKYALSHSDSNDLILLSGKGHEKYILRNGHYTPFDEEKIISTFWDLL